MPTIPPTTTNIPVPMPIPMPVPVPTAATYAAVRFTQTRANAAGAQAVNRSSVAALAFLVFDIALTFGEEVELVWPKRLSWTKVLFFFVRYFAVLVQISILFVGTELSPQFHFTPHACFLWQVWQGLSAMLIICSVDIILITRVYALYAEQRAVRIALAIAFCIEISTMGTSLALALPGITTDEVCTVTSTPRTIFIYGAATILFQILLFALTAAKFVHGLRMPVRRRTPVLDLLARDGTWAFGLLMLVILLQAAMYALPREKSRYAGVFYAWVLTTFSFCGYRILLNIQRLSPTPAQRPSSHTFVHNRARRAAPAAEEAGRGETEWTDTELQFTSAISMGGVESVREEEGWEVVEEGRGGRGRGVT